MPRLISFTGRNEYAAYLRYHLFLDRGFSVPDAIQLVREQFPDLPDSFFAEKLQ